MRTVASTPTTYIGDYFEWTTSTMKQYYDAGGVRVAMRTDFSTPNWLLGDHLAPSVSLQGCFASSTAITTDVDGNLPVGEVRYKAWGEDVGCVRSENAPF